MNDQTGLALLPYSVPGSDPGSTYRVVARTANHYVAVRRLSEHTFRIRLARIDEKPLDLNGTSAQDWENNYGFRVGASWTYMSCVTTSVSNAEQVVMRLIRVAMIHDSTLEGLPNDNTPEGIAADKYVAMVAQKLAAISTATETEDETPTAVTETEPGKNKFN